MDQMRVDPAELRRAASELTRLADVVRASRAGADARVVSLAGRAGDLQQPALDQWRASATALDRLESDFVEIGRALGELADYFADLDRQAVGR